MSDAAQTLPHSEECERAVLGGALIENSVIPSLRAKLAVRDFYDNRHQWIWEAICQLSDERTSIDPLTVQVRLEEMDVDVGGLGYLSNLECELPDLNNVDAYVDTVTEHLPADVLSKLLRRW